jgi:ABC-type transport system substrate-binding protein
MDPDQVGLAGGTIGYENITDITDAGGGKCLVHLGQFRDPATNELRAPKAGETSFYAGYIGLFSPLLPAHYISTIPVASAATDLYPLGDIGSGVYSGPYIPTTYTSGAQLEYKPNDAYWAAKGTSPNLAGVIFKYYPDNPDGEVQGYTQGEFDLGMDLNHTNLPSFYTDPNDPSKGFQAQYSNVFTEDALEYELWPLNNARISSKYGGVNLDAIKQAISMIAPKQDVVDRANGGTVGPIAENNFVSPLSWFYKQEPAINVAPGDTELAAAQALLCGASCDPNDPNGGNTGAFSMGKDGYLHLGINDAILSLDACTTARPGRADAVGLLADQAKKIGIQINTDPPYGVVPSQPNFFGAWTSVPDDTPCNLIHGNYDIAEHAYVVPSDPTGSYNVYTCAAIPESNPSHNGQNETRTCNASFDAAWQTVVSNIDPAKIATAMGAVQDFYSSNVVEVPLFFWKNVYLVNPKLHNVVGNPTTASVVWNVEDMWLEP